MIEQLNPNLGGYNKEQGQPFEELSEVIKNLEKNEVEISRLKEERSRLLKDLESYGDVDGEKVKETLKKYSGQEAK